MNKLLNKLKAINWFVSILDDLGEPVEVDNGVGLIYYNSKDEWMIYDKKNNCFRLSYERILSILEETYGMDYSEFQEFTKSILVKYLNWEVGITNGWYGDVD